MSSIVRWSTSFRLLVVGIAAGLLGLAALRVPSTPVDVLPEFTPPYVEVQTEALGLAAEEVEQLITVPLEADLLHGVAWLQEIRSESVPGLSSIVLLFEPGTDVIRARQMVAERLTQAHFLPNVSKPPTMLQPLSSSSRVLMVGLRSDEVSLIDMSVLARWTIRPRLMGVPGVANVAIWGQRERQLQVQVDPVRLRENGVTLQQVIATTGNALWFSPLTFLDASTPGTGGFIDTPNQRVSIQHILPITTPEDLARVAIEPAEDSGSMPRAGEGLRLGDVADVVEDHQPLIGDAVVDGGPGLLLVVEKFPGADTLAVTRGLEEALAAMQPGLGGIEVDSTVFRPATDIEAALGNVGFALVVGLVLGALVLGAVLAGIRPALVAVLPAAFSLVAATLVLSLLGATINALVIAGLVAAVGVVIDDALGATHAMRHRLTRLPGSAPRDRTAVVHDALVESRGPLSFATLIILFALVPLLFIGGSATALLPPLAAAYAVALLASTFVALTLTPALAVLLLPPGDARPEPRLGRRLRDGYDRLLSRAAGVARPAILTAALAGVALVAVAGLAVASPTRAGLVPEFRAHDLLVRWEAPPGTSHQEMTRQIREIGAAVRAVPGVRDVGGHLGRAIQSDRVVNVNAGEMWIGIDQNADYGRTVDAVEDVLDGFPGLGRALASYPDDRVTDVLGQADDDVAVRVYGQGLSTLRAQAAEVQRLLEGIDGVASTAIEPEVEEPTLRIQVDLEAAEAHGVKPGDVRRSAAALLSGLEVGSLFEEQKVFEVVVWGVPSIRESVDAVRDLRIDTPGGGQVRLAEVADVSVAPAPSVIRREGVMRRLDVFADVEGRDVSAVAADIEVALGATTFPLEYHAEVLGGFAEQEAIRVRLAIAAVATLLGVLLLLQAAVGSWRLAAMLALAIPAALAGGVLAMIVVDRSLSLGAVVGLLTVLAIAVRHAVAWVDRYQRLIRDDPTVDPFAAARRVSHDRLAPVLGTAVATTAVLLPFLVAGDRVGFEVIRPMAVVVLGGLATTTVTDLFVVPLLGMRAGPSAQPGAEPTRRPEPAGLSPA